MKTTLGILAMLGIAATVGMTSPVLAEEGPAKRGFGQMDSNGIGRLSDAEIAQLREQRFTEADSNGDGLLSREEIVQGMEQRRAERMNGHVERMIEARDTDGDGQLSADEMNADPRRVAMFDRIDQDGDGQISQEEFDSFKPERPGGRDGHHMQRERHSDRMRN